MRLTKILIGLGLVASLCVAGAATWLWQTHGAYGFNTLLRRGGTYWITIKRDDPRLSPSMRTALQENPPLPSEGTFVWRQVGDGFETAEMPVLSGGKEVDRILLNRIDPKLYRFVALNDPSGLKGVDEWERALPRAALIVNGSYYGPHGEADTPIVSNGVAAGPSTYNAKAGAFVAGDGFAHIADLSGQSWQQAFAGASNAMVSYPMLIRADGAIGVKSNSGWLANRTFVGEDRSGKIIIGTTQDAFFPLAVLADFLKWTSLDLRVALNLDGGPIACQSVRLNGFNRKFYATWEAQVSGEEVRLLRWPLSSATWAMPMVLAVEPR